MVHVNKQTRAEKQEEQNVLEERLAWARQWRGRAKACPGKTANKEANRQTNPNLDQQSPSEILADGPKPVRAPKEEGAQKVPEMEAQATFVHGLEKPESWVWKRVQDRNTESGLAGLLVARDV